MAAYWLRQERPQTVGLGETQGVQSENAVDWIADASHANIEKSRPELDPK